MKIVAERSPAPQVRRLLEDAALFRALALAFAYPSQGRPAEVAAGLERVAAARGRRRGTSELRRAHEVWARCAAGESPAGEYVRLFLGECRCPPYETAYGDGRRIAGRPVELADVHGFYRAFGFDLSASNPDLPDHLAAELEFYSLLLVKEAYARASDWTDKADLTYDAASAFLEQHLGRWIGAFAAGLTEHAAADPYLSSVALLEAAIAEQCRRRRITPQPCTAALPADPMQAECFTCPHAAAPQ